ncbi:MAG: calcium/sodium antiporter [Alphaproteobacteria bacterium]|nr:calcium/sodium antiporter [Alphaproteobacteria bacterium]
MLLDIVMVAAGLAILVFSGDALVKGAFNLALRLGIPALVVGLTVVAFGTSAPELIVSVKAAIAGQAGIALGNVVGSNIVNVLLILGLPALFVTIRSSTTDTRHGFAVMIGASLLFIALCFMGPLSWWHGLVLLAGLALMIGDNLRTARAHRAANEPAFDRVQPGMALWKETLFIVVGIVGLGIGADLLVDGAVNIARALGVSETVIGLTLVAIGTSLPELVTSFISAIRRQADVAMGNVIGSNTFNLLAIIGAAALFGDMEVPEQLLTFDLWFMLAVSLLLVPFVFLRRDMGRALAVVFVAIYAAYAVALVA